MKSDTAFKYKWYSKGDIDAYFGLLFDSIAKVLTAIGVMIFGFKMPHEIVYNRILPGIAVAIFIGNLWYAYEAWHLARKEGRQDVTAQPYGIGAGQIFGWLFLIIAPVYFMTNNAVTAWQVGLAACFLGGLIEICGAFLARIILKYIPRAALLGNLAAAGIVWLSFVSMANIFNSPYVALIPLVIVLLAYFGKIRMPLNLPAGLVAIIIGTAIAWIKGDFQTIQVVESTAYVGFNMPILCISDIIEGMTKIVPFLPIIIPLQVQNFLSTLQSVESAAAAGDSYPPKASMIMDGVGTTIGAIFGNPFPTTVFIGHPCWKEVGAKAGYSVLNGVTYIVVCLTGAVGVIAAVIPYQAVMAVLVFVGLIIAQQAFSESKKEYAPAILLGTIPVIAQYVQQGVEAGLSAAGTSLDKVDIAAFAASSFPIAGVLALSQGAFLSSLFLAAWMVCIIDKNYAGAAISGALLCISSSIGLIHAQQLGWLMKTARPFSLVYFFVTLLAIAMHVTSVKKREEELPYS